jgi:hypothetical protein
VTSRPEPGSALAEQAPEAVMRIVQALRERQDEIIGKGIAAMRREIKSYARNDDPAFLADVWDHVQLHNDAWSGRARSRPRSCCSSDLLPRAAWGGSRSGSS